MGGSGKPNYLRFGKRHILAICLFTGFMNCYILRVSINTAIISMVNDTVSTSSPKNVTNSTGELVCPFPEEENNTTPAKQGELDWDHATRGLILSSFYYGYICTQLLGGYLPQIIGGRIPFGISIAGTAALTLVIPVAARTSASFLIAIRVIQGVLQGVIFPCNHYLLGNWAPKQERTILVMISLTGTDVGAVVAAPLTSLLCEYGFDGGWASSFYIFGAVGLLWCAVWFFFVADSPAKHSTISAEERKYIEENCESDTKPVPFCQVPWKAIILSPRVWAVAIAETTFGWNYYTLSTQLSTYLNDVLHVSKSLNGLLACLPYIGLVIVETLAGALADIARAKGVPTTWVRKISHIFGMYSSAAILICIGYVGCDTTLVIVLLCLSVSVSGFGYAGYIVNYIDIAPRYGGLLMGFGNTWGQLGGILSPILAGAIVNEESNISTWQTIFYMSAGITAGGATLFALMSDGEVQKWARVDETKHEEQQANSNGDLPMRTSANNPPPPYQAIVQPASGSTEYEEYF